MSDNRFALRFISGKYQGGEFPLPPDSEIVIGRGGELDIVLVEDMVSRKHAKITTTLEEITLQDLGSTNGSFVNGEKIKKTKLKEGDRILIGTSILKLISADDARVSHDSGQSLNQILKQSHEQHGTQGATGMSGSLAEVAIPDLLQLFSTSRKSGTLCCSNTEDEGKVYLREGQIFYATWNDSEELGPLKALFRMMGWMEGEFRLEPPQDEEFVLELEEPTDQLILECCRQLDEYKVLEPELPEVEDMLAIDKPLTPSLSDLDKEELEVFQLVFNNGFFQSVLDESPHSDLKTASIVHRLMKDGYIHV